MLNPGVLLRSKLAEIDSNARIAPAGGRQSAAGRLGEGARCERLRRGDHRAPAAGGGAGQAGAGPGPGLAPAGSPGGGAHPRRPRAARRNRPGSHGHEAGAPVGCGADRPGAAVLDQMGVLDASLDVTLKSVRRISEDLRQPPLDPGGRRRTKRPHPPGAGGCDTRPEEEYGLDRIRQVPVNVNDLDRAVAFYRDVLGIRPLFQAPRRRSSTVAASGSCCRRRSSITPPR